MTQPLSILKKHLPLALMVLCSISALAQTTNVQFLVNMNYQIALGNFKPATQTTDVAGTFNTWGSPTTVLTDANGDGIYTATVPLTIGTTIAFKTRINAKWDGTEEFSGGGANRSYTVTANGVVSYWYNDAIPAGTPDVRATPSAYVVQPGQNVQFTDASLGSPVSWSWTMPGATPATSTAQNPVVSYANAGSYEVTLSVANAAGQTAVKTFPNFIKAAAMNTFWWNDRVFYEVFVRSFKDSNGDGNGDLKGLISQLDYLNDGNPNTTADLGITGLWLMPIQQSPSYHGYDVTDYKTVETDYGTNADFTALIEAAHARGIKVIIDMVMNHTSSAHPWFIASAAKDAGKRDWYVWKDTNPGTPGPFDNVAWFQKNGAYYYGAFWSEMPDLNFYNPQVRDEFKNIANYWLTDMKADGFRLDAAKFLYEDGAVTQNTPETIAYWQDFRNYYKSVNPDAFAVGEVGDTTSAVAPYVNNNGLDYCFEFDLADAMILSLNTGTATALTAKMVQIMQAYPFLQFGTFLSNHDTNRIMSQLGSDAAKAKAAAALLLTLPGIPYIYYGEEIGMTGVKPDEQIRTPMQWTAAAGAGFTTGTPWYAVNSDYTAKNVAAQQAVPTSLWQHYRTLIGLRQTENTLTKGNFVAVDASSPALFAYVRQYQNETVLVIINTGAAALTNSTLSLPYTGLVPGTYTMPELLGGSPKDITIDANGGFSGLTIASLAAKGILIYKLQAQLNVKQPVVPATALYPNPATNRFSLTMATQSVAVYALSGQLVKRFPGAGAGSAYDVSGLAKGIYLVKITNSSNNVSAVKLVKE